VDFLNAIPTFSIVIEWENARFTELNRTRRMLRALRDQLINLQAPVQPPQIIFLHDRRIIDEALVRQVVGDELKPDSLPVVTRIIQTDGLRYYEQKNFGALQAEAEIKIFLDCDVVPESGWLAAILESFRNPDVGAVAGETYVECAGLYSKAFALFWIFGLRDPSSDLRPAPSFYANNVAFRADVFARYSFPNLQTYRGQCFVLSETLHANGIGLFVQKRARVSHPVPIGLWFFIARALNAGRDEVLCAVHLNQHNRLLLPSISRNYKNSVVSSFRKIRKHGRDVELGTIAAIAAYGIAFAYFSLKTIGEVLTFIRPNVVRRMFKV
jgi:hypothetical protein